MKDKVIMEYKRLWSQATSWCEKQNSCILQITFISMYLNVMAPVRILLKSATKLQKKSTNFGRAINYKSSDTIYSRCLNEN